MKRFCLMFLLIFFGASCGPSDKEKKAATEQDDFRLGISYWTKLQDAVRDTSAEGFETDDAFYASLPYEQRVADLASRVVVGTEDIAYNGLDGQIPFIVKFLRTEVKTPAAIARADALESVAPYLAKQGVEAERDGHFFKATVVKGKALVDSLDASLKTSGNEFETDVARWFGRLKRSL